MEKINHKRQVRKASIVYVVRFVLVTTIFILVLFAASGPSPTFGQTLSSTVTRVQPPELFTWINGYNLAFVPRNYNKSIILRSFENDEWKHTEITNLNPDDNIDIDGLELARDLSGTRSLSLMGVLKNGTAYFHPGEGTDFERSTNYLLKNVGVPAIVYVGESRPASHPGKSCWAVAVRYPNKRVTVRPLLIKPGDEFDGFVNSDLILGYEAYGDPSIAYHNGRLVVAWLHQRPGVSKFRTFTATVLHNENTDGFDLVNRNYSGALPDSPSGTKIDVKARPALTHDGRGLFYAAVIKYVNTAFVHLYSSADGVNWTPEQATIPGNGDYKAGLSQVSLAALPNGEILLMITTTDQAVNSTNRDEQIVRIYKRLSDGSWTELLDKDSVMSIHRPQILIPFSLIRSQYRGPIRDIYRDIYRGPVTYP